MLVFNLNSGINDLLLDEIIKFAEYNDIGKVVLFGSRARGDYNNVSDIDIAVTGGDVISFSIDVEEKTNTLLKFDVVNLDGAVQKELLESINREGVVVYEKI